VTARLFSRLAGAAGIALVAAAACAQEWPSKPIRVVVPFAAGSVGEAILRTMSPGIEGHLGQRFVLESKPGADGVIGTTQVVRAAPDGYTLLLASTSVMAVKPHLFKDLGFDPLLALEPIVMLADAPLLAIAPASLPARSLRDVAEAVRAHPGQFNYGSQSAGSITHLTGAFFSLQNGNAMVHIPYKGTPPLVQALLAGDIQLAFPTYTGVSAQLKAGKLKALAVMAKQRLAELPEVPTAVEAGFPQLVSGNWWMLAAPRGTPGSVIERLGAEFRAALAEADVKKRLAHLGQVPLQLSAAETPAFLQAESARYKSIVERGGIKPE
jgi:tripartite-type tricarboxylate transporter receptor subunit TctC